MSFAAQIKSYLFDKRKILIISILIIASTFAVYWQVIDHDFLSFDDETYVTKNEFVQTGITLKNILWSFDVTGREYWHPLTWISHMLDCELFGLDSGAHHLVNVFFHSANILLLLFILIKMTGEVWKSAFVAALFALHPINVDSVAWLAERKNLLSTLFWILTMISYFYYVQRPGSYRYIVLFAAFILGLLSKPMLVTLPFVLILLDYWPLKRMQFELAEDTTGKISKSGWGWEGLRYTGTPVTRLVLEKIPLLIFSLVIIWISSASIKAIKTSGLTVSTDLVPINLRVANAIVSYISYLWKMIWPLDLTFFYPYPQMVPLWKVFISLIILIFTTVLSVRLVRRAPYFIVGWLWFLGTLVPVSGIVQGGLWPAIAERWAYVPFIGLFIICAWGFSDLVSRLRYKKVIVFTTAFVLLGCIMLKTWSQVHYWKDNMTLYGHGIEVDPQNYVAFVNLGVEFMEQEEIEKAIEYYNKSLAVRPNYPKTHFNLAIALAAQGETEAAIEHYITAIHLKPGDIQPYINLGSLFLEQGDIEEANRIFSKASLIDPDSREISNNIGATLVKKGQKVDAFKHFLNVVEKDPGNAFAYNNLGVLSMEEGKIDDAMGYFSSALQANPDYAEAHKNLAILLGKRGKGEDSIQHFLEVVRIDSENEQAHYNLGIILSRQGDKIKACDHFRKVLRINPENAETHYAYAVCLTGMERLDGAISHFQEAIRLNNNFEQARRMLDITRARKEKIDMTISQIRQRLKNDPMNLDLLQKTALLHKMKGDFDNALIYMQKMTEIQAGNPEILYNIACIYSKQNRVDESLNYLRKAIDNGFDNWDLIREDEDLEYIRDSEQFKEIIPGN